MNTKKIYLLFCSVLFFVSTGVFSQSALNEYLKVAALNNPDLKTSFNNYMAAVQKVNQVGALPETMVAFGYFIQPVETKVGPQRATVNMSQSFPWFGLLKTKKTVASNLADAKFELFNNKKEALFFEVKSAYYQYYFIEKAIEITQQNIAILQVFKRLSLVKIESGKATAADELRVELELNDLQNQLALLKDTKHTLLVKFNNLLLKEPNSPIVVPTVLWQNSVPYTQLEMMEQIYNSNYELKSIDYRLAAFAEQKKVTKKEAYPSFTLGFNYVIIGKDPTMNSVNNGKDAFMFPSIGLKIPIFSHKYKAMAKEANFLYEAEKFSKIAQKKKLSNVFSNTQKNYNDAERRILLNKKQSLIAKKILDLLMTSYSTSETNFEEVLRVEKKLLGYELAYQQALVDKNTAIAFMNYLLGK